MGTLHKLSTFRPGWKPYFFSGCVLWLRSDQGLTLNEDDEVTAWQSCDRIYSEKFEIGTQAVPQWIANQLNSQPAVRFNGINTALYKMNSQTAAAFTSDEDELEYTWFMVWKPTLITDGSSHAPFGFCSLKNSDPTEYCSLSLYATYSSKAGVRSLRHQLAAQATSQYATGNNPTPLAGTWHLLTTSGGLGSPFVTIQNSNTDIGMSVTQNLACDFYSFSVGCQIGWYTPPPTDIWGQHYSFDLAELIMYKPKLTAEQITAVKNYLNRRYAIY